MIEANQKSVNRGVSPTNRRHCSQGESERIPKVLEGSALVFWSLPRYDPQKNFVLRQSVEKLSKRIDPMAQLDKRVATESRFFKMVTTALPSYRFTNIFDVGANVGQTCIPMASFLPEARIFAFEPVPLTFSTLKNNTSSFNNIIPIPLALGDRDGIISMHAEGTSVANYIVKDNGNFDKKIFQ